MSGLNPHARLGLIALLAARRVKAEKVRRQRLAAGKPMSERAAEPPRKRRGWFG